MNQEKKDILNEIFDMDFIDSFLDYEDCFSNNRFYHYLKGETCKKFIDTFSKRDNCFLDAGAGRGPYTKLATTKFNKVLCFEYNQSELERAKINLTNLSNILFQKVDLTDIPLNDNSIDAAICSEVLEHIPDNKKAISEIYRVMKPGSSLLISMPNSNSLLYWPSKIKNRKLLKQGEKAWEEKGCWERLRHLYFTPSKIESLVKDAGFNITKKYGAYIVRIPHGPRKFLMKDFPFLFKYLVKIDRSLGNIIPELGAFYFLTLKK